MNTSELLPLTMAAAEIGISYGCLISRIKCGNIRAVYTGAKRMRARYITREEVNRAKCEEVR